MWDVIVLIPGHCLSVYFPYAGAVGILLLKNGKFTIGKLESCLLFNLSIGLCRIFNFKFT